MVVVVKQWEQVILFSLAAFRSDSIPEKLKHIDAETKV
jgi:hypothetical protein